VLSFCSSRWNWDSPTLSPQVSVHPPFTFRREGALSLVGEGVGGPISDAKTYTVVLYVFIYFMISTLIYKNNNNGNVMARKVERK
jgi:hypothetical protein